MVDGKLPKARQALLSDAVATSSGALLGTSTVTSYIESASGISAGGRTGLTNIVTAALMLLALFFHPLIKWSEQVMLSVKVRSCILLLLRR